MEVFYKRQLGTTTTFRVVQEALLTMGSFSAVRSFQVVRGESEIRAFKNFLIFILLVMLPLHVSCLQTSSIHPHSFHRSILVICIIRPESRETSFLLPSA